MSEHCFNGKKGDRFFFFFLSSLFIYFLSHFRTGLLYPPPLILIQPENSSTETCSLPCTDSSNLVQLSNPSSHSWSSESCDEAVAFKQLAFSSWKVNLTEGNLRSFHKAQQVCVSTLRRGRKEHLSNLKNKVLNSSPSL